MVTEKILLPDGTIQIRVVPEFETAIEVPAEIQMWQARTMIERMGLTQAVNEAVAFANNEEIRIAWEYAPNVVRKSAFVAAMAAAIGLTDGQLDTLFIEAAKVK